jgi:hypothetical protein
MTGTTPITTALAVMLPETEIEARDQKTDAGGL